MRNVKANALLANEQSFVCCCVQQNMKKRMLKLKVGTLWGCMNCIDAPQLYCSRCTFHPIPIPSDRPNLQVHGSGNGCTVRSPCGQLQGSSLEATARNPLTRPKLQRVPPAMARLHITKQLNNGPATVSLCAVRNGQERVNGFIRHRDDVVGCHPLHTSHELNCICVCIKNIHGEIHTYCLQLDIRHMKESPL